MHTRTHELKTTILLLGVLTLAVLVRIPFLIVPMISDEGGYAYVAHFWSGDYQLYKDIPFDRPQGIFLIYKLALATFGDDAWKIRLFAGCYNALTTLCIFVVAKTLFTESLALLAAAVFAVFSACPSFEGFTANAELFMLLPLTLAAFFTWKQKWFWAGVLAGVASAVKPSGCSGLVLAFVWIGLIDRKPRHFLSTAAGFGLIVLASAVHGYAIDWGSYWNSLVDRRFNAFSVATVPVFDQIDRITSGFTTSFPAFGIPLFASLFAAWTIRTKETRFVALWFASSWVGMALGGMWYYHYFQQILPPLAVLAPQAIPAWRRASFRWVWVVPLACVLMISVTGDLPLWFAPPNSISWSLYRRPAYIHADEISTFIQRESRPEEPVYVAFSEAQTYYLSRRRAAVPQLYLNEILFIPGLFEQVMDSIRQGKPKVIIVSGNLPRRLMKGQTLEAILQGRYEQKAQFDRITGWVRKDESP